MQRNQRKREVWMRAARETRESVASTIASRGDHLGAETRRRVGDFEARLLELSLLPSDRLLLVAPPLLSHISCKHEQ